MSQPLIFINIHLTSLIPFSSFGVHFIDVLVCVENIDQLKKDKRKAQS